MQHLILKDLMITKRNMIPAVIFGFTWAIVGAITKEIFLSIILQSVAILFIIFIVVISAINYDEKSNADIVLNSFPIKRYELVKAKYISTIIIILLSCVLIYILTNIVSLFATAYSRVANPMSLVLVLIIISICLIYYSFYLPLYYYSIGKAKFINTMIYFLLIVAPSGAKKILGKNIAMGWLSKIPYVSVWSIAGVILVFTIATYYLSYTVSRKIYEGKEF